MSASQINQGFTSLSTNGILSGCIGTIDGWLCPMKAPSKNEVANVKSFFSGHYHRYGVNVQACWDHLCRFTAFGVKWSGGTNDVLTFQDGY